MMAISLLDFAVTLRTVAAAAGAAGVQMRPTEKRVVQSCQKVPPPSFGWIAAVAVQPVRSTRGLSLILLLPPLLIVACCFHAVHRMPLLLGLAAAVVAHSFCPLVCSPPPHFPTYLLCWSCAGSIHIRTNIWNIWNILWWKWAIFFLFNYSSRKFFKYFFFLKKKKTGSLCSKRECRRSDWTWQFQTLGDFAPQFLVDYFHDAAMVNH